MRFAYMKATQGKEPFVDQAALRRNYQAAKEAGLAYGACHVFSFCQPAIEQLSVIKEIVPFDPDALPIAIDVEWSDFPAIRREEQCKDIPTITGSLRSLEQMLREIYRKTPCHLWFDVFVPGYRPRIQPQPDLAVGLPKDT
jgi:lysozyme